MPRNLGRWFLLGASLVFYATWNAWYVPGFLVLIGVNYLLGSMAAGPRRRTAVVAAVLVDLGFLAMFKYLDWAVGTGASVVTWITGEPIDAPVLGLILPLAISFVTFTMLAYVIDVYRGGRPERSPMRFALFVTFFPHLIAGPIMRAREFLPQLRHPRPFSWTYLPIAAPLLVGGLLKKTLGDQLAPGVAVVFGDPAAASTAGLWIGAVAFGFQIYLDFSGYTDMALGSAALMGYRLPRNFDWPYRSLSIQDFWRTWHMTLSRWLRDYLYIPLGGSRHGEARTYMALMTTMTLGGLWHGAGLTFIVWGAWHGIGLSVQRWWRSHRGDPAAGGTGDAPHRGIPPLLAWALTFGFVTVGWIFFRSLDLDDSLTYLSGMVTPHGGRQPFALPIILGLVLGSIAQWPRVAREAIRLVPATTGRRVAVYGAALLVAVLLAPVAPVDFIYFQF